MIYYLTPAKVKKSDTVSGKLRFYLWGSQNTVSALFFCCSRLYGWKMYRISEAEEVCLCFADPADRSGKYKGRHDRLVVGIFTAMTLGLLVFF